MTIHIEICKSPWKKNKDKWNIRIGDIEGGTESLNINEKDLLEEISEQLKIEKELKEKNI